MPLDMSGQDGWSTIQRRDVSQERSASRLKKKQTSKGEKRLMTTPLPYPIHTIAAAAVQIDHGEDPWFALGNFLHDWWCYAADHRQALIGEPLPFMQTAVGRDWATFCAATVEELCCRTNYPCPSWVNQPRYQREQPWYFSSETAHRDWLRTTAPEPFRRRNLFVGAGVLDNKYELQHLFPSRPRWSVWSDQDLQEQSEA